MIGTEIWAGTEPDDKITPSHGQPNTGWLNTQSSRLKCLTFLVFIGLVIILSSFDRSAIGNLWLNIHSVIALKHKSAGNLGKNINGSLKNP